MKVTQVYPKETIIGLWYAVFFYQNLWHNCFFFLL